MALRIGKKKDAPAGEASNAPTDDWSDAALLGQSDEPISAPTPAVAPGAAIDPADDFVTETFAPAPRKKPVSPALLAGGLVLFLTVVGVGAYFAFFNTPVEEDAPIAAPRRVAKIVRPTPIPVKLKTPVKSKTGAPVKKVAPGRAGIASPGTKTPALRSSLGKAPSVVPKPNMPTPVPLMPDGMAAQPGKGSMPGTTVQIVRPVAPVATALQAQLKALWKQGADAKHERNYNGARAAWGKMLKLHPGHPGVQEAIEKLPR